MENQQQNEDLRKQEEIKQEGKIQTEVESGLKVEEEPKKKSSKNYLNWIVLIILLIVIKGFWFGDGITPRSSTEDTMKRFTEYVTSKEWREFNSIIGQFKVYFPGKPTYTKETMPYLDTGIEVTIDMYMATQSNETTYGVEVGRYSIEIDPAYTKGMLEGAINGIIVSTEGNELVSSRFTTFQGYQAVDFLIQNKKENVGMKGKIFIAEQTLYVPFVVYYPENYNESDYNKFINSFTLMK